MSVRGSRGFQCATPFLKNPHLLPKYHLMSFPNNTNTKKRRWVEVVECFIVTIWLYCVLQFSSLRSTRRHAYCCHDCRGRIAGLHSVPSFRRVPCDRLHHRSAGGHYVQIQIFARIPINFHDRYRSRARNESIL